MNHPQHHPARPLLPLAAVATLVGLVLASGAAIATPLPTTSPAATVATGQRPASVPAEFMPTPNGYLHPDCVHQVGANQVVLPNGSGEVIVDLPAAALAELPQSGDKSAADLVTAADKAKGRQIPACGHPRFDLHGKPVAPGKPGVPEAGTVPDVTGWVADASATVGSMSYLRATWTVPPAPTVIGPQTVYFFPGLQNLTGTPIIMQPVLAWNQIGSGFTEWSIASWNCCSVGNTYHSEYLPVTGATVYGTITGTGCSSSTGVCSTWKIVTKDNGSLASTSFTTTAGGRKMNWTFGAALEVYSVSECGQFPGSSVIFSGLYFKNVAGTRKYPSWTYLTTDATPQCGYSVKGTSSTITVKY
ncbi:MAG: hypothetical protein IPL43_06995 [Micropruina sp.]|nr:hypothetical protein [Micropruina sp.]